MRNVVKKCFLACILFSILLGFQFGTPAYGLQSGFLDNMESGASQWTATGFWHQVQDGVSPYPNSHSATHSWWFGQDATGTYDNGSLVSGNLTSVPFYLPANSTLTYWSWESTENVPGYDTRKVYLSNDNGASWVKVFESFDNSSSWHKVSVDLSAYGGQPVELKFVFDSVDNTLNNYRGWYLDDIAVFSNPASVITAPAPGAILSGSSSVISGTASDNSTTGLRQVDVSVNGGAWQTAAGTASWSLSWNLPPDGNYSIKSRATDNAGNVESPGTGITVLVDNILPSTTIMSPASGAAVKGTSVRLSGTATDGSGSGVAKEEISTDGGNSWVTATGTTSWYYDWTLPSPAAYTMWRVASAWLRDGQSNETRTVRVTHLLNAYGSKVRVGFVSGPTQAIVIDEAYIGNDAGGGAVSGNLPLTFGGNASVVVPAGGTVYSDPVTWNAVPGGTVVITSYGTGTSWAKSYDYVGYYEDGNVASATRALANTGSSARGYDIWNALLVEVLNDGTTANENVLIIGDSITVGNSSYDIDFEPEPGGGESWARLLGAKVNVYNAALDATTAAFEAGTITSILGRGIRYDKAIVSLGTNDIHYYYTESEIESNLSSIFQSLESAGIPVIAGNIIPRSYPDSREAVRVGVNNWLATLPSGIQGVIDFDAAVRDPANPANMLPDYDSGDHIHPNELGHSAMYDAIDSGNLFTAGMVFDISARATDVAGNVENPAPTVRVNVDNLAPVSVIENVQNGSIIAGAAYTIRGHATDGVGSGVAKIEVSTDGGATWNLASGACSWSYNWTMPVSGSFLLLCRATDRAGNTEIPGIGAFVTISPFGAPELQHFNWDPSTLAGDCSFCHKVTQTFLKPSFRDDAGFCYTCHNPSGVGHGRSLYGSRGHSLMKDVTSAGGRFPTYGAITDDQFNNQPFSRLQNGRKVLCVTCHNIMRKSEDYGRVWEYTATSDYATFTLQRGGWAAYGNLMPEVYRDTSLWAGPAESKDRRDYLVDPREYTYDESAGTVTFKTVQPSSVYIYVTLDYPYIRASSQDNRLCSDCHTQTTHKGANCLVCHQAHNTGNIAGIKDKVRTTDLSERTVSFLRITGMNSFADRDSIYDGICEVCHTLTKYYRRDGTGFANHSGGVNYDGTNCTACHSHSTGFAR